MSIEAVRKYFAEFGMEGRIQEFETSSATVALAAEALHCEEERIAKTLAFQKDDEVILIVVAGDRKLITASLRHTFKSGHAWLLLIRSKKLWVMLLVACVHLL